MNSRTAAFLTIIGLLGAPIAANAASVTYDFTGTVTEGTGIYAGLSGPVSGTYTINIANANPAQSNTTVPVSLTSNWTLTEETGSLYGISPSSAYIFSDTVNIGAVSYATATPGSYQSTSTIQSSFTGTEYNASERQTSITPTSITTESTFALSNSTGAYTSDGLPVGFALGQGNTGDFGEILNDTASEDSFLEYSLTSLTPVPLPAAAWLMLSGFAGLGAFARKRLAA